MFQDYAPPVSTRWSKPLYYGDSQIPSRWPVLWHPRQTELWHCSCHPCQAELRHCRWVTNACFTNFNNVNRTATNITNICIKQGEDFSHQNYIILGGLNHKTLPPKYMPKHINDWHWISSTTMRGKGFCVHNSMQACSHEQSELSCIFFVCYQPCLVCLFNVLIFVFLFLFLALRAPWVESPNKILKPGNILAHLEFAQNTKAYKHNKPLY